MTDIALVIVHYNGLEGLGRCLGSVEKDVEIILIDTSTEGESRSFAPTVSQWVHLPANRGYGWACNIGIAAAHSSFVCVSNSDVKFLPSALLTLCEAAESCGGIVAPIQQSESGALGGDNLVPGVSLRNLVAQWLWLGRSRIAAAKKVLGRNVALDDPIAPITGDWSISGACVGAAVDTWEALGGFDERIWLYHEDVDLSRRCMDRGIPLNIATRSRVVHTSGTNERGITIEALTASLWGQQLAWRSSGRPSAVVRWVQALGCVLRAAVGVCALTPASRLWLTVAKSALMEVERDPRTA